MMARETLEGRQPGLSSDPLPNLDGRWRRGQEAHHVRRDLSPFAAAPQPQQQRPQTHPPLLRILLAEDNLVNQKVALRVLEKVHQGAPYSVVVVADGAAVLRALEESVFDLVLMDLHMPMLDGLQAARKIQETYSEADRPRIIAVSADAGQALRKECEAAGMESFITKPFKVEDFQQVVQSRRRVQHHTPLL